MPLIKLKNLSAISGKNYFINLGKSFFQSTKNMYIIGWDTCDNNPILEHVFFNNPTGYTHDSTLRKKQRLLDALKSDLSEMHSALVKKQLAFPEKNHVISTLLKRVIRLQTFTNDDRLIPILSERVIYDFKQNPVNPPKKKSFSILKQFIIEHPDDPDAQQLRSTIFDERGALKHIYSKSELNSTMRNILIPQQMQRIMYRICLLTPELSGKEENIYACQNTEAFISEVSKLIKENKLPEKKPVSFMIRTRNSFGINGHLTSVTLIKDNTNLKIIGIDSIAGDFTYKTVLGNLINHLKEQPDLSQLNIQCAFSRNNSQKDTRTCGIYTLLDTIDMQLSTFDEINEIMDRLERFEKNEKYVLNKTLRITQKLINPELPEYHRQYLKEKLTEYLLYLGAMRYVRDNPTHRDFNYERLEKILDDGFGNIFGSIFSQLFIHCNESQICETFMQKINTTKISNIPNLINDIINKNKNNVIKYILSNPEKYTLLGDILTGDNDGRKFMKGTDISIERYNEKFIEKEQKTLKLLGDRSI